MAAMDVPSNGQMAKRFWKFCSSIFKVDQVNIFFNNKSITILFNYAGAKNNLNKLFHFLSSTISSILIP